MLRSFRFNLRTLFFFMLLAAVDGWLTALLKPELEREPDGYLVMGFLCVVLIYLGFVARHIAVVTFERTSIECFAIQTPRPAEPADGGPSPESAP